MHDRFDGFLLAYFGNGTEPDAEQVRFAVTPGREPQTWIPLDGGRPVVRSDVGERGVRDPFILRRFLTGALSWTITWYDTDGVLNLDQLAEQALLLVFREP